jgi:hypothetical protein
MLSHGLSQIPDARAVCDAVHEYSSHTVSEYFTYQVEVITYYVNWAVQNQAIARLAQSLHVPTVTVTAGSD